MQVSGSTARRTNASQSIERSYRLIKGSGEPHRQLDSHCSPLDDAIEWIGLLSEPDHPTSLIGAKLSSTYGDWLTSRLPGSLLCPLPR